MNKIELIKSCEKFLTMVATQQNVNEGIIFKLVTNDNLSNLRFTTYNPTALTTMLNQLIGMSHVHDLQKGLI